MAALVFVSKGAVSIREAQEMTTVERAVYTCAFGAIQQEINDAAEALRESMQDDA